MRIWAIGAVLGAILACLVAAPVAGAAPGAAQATPAGPFVTVLLGRSMWAQNESCQVITGQPTLLDLAPQFAARGVRPAGVIVPARTRETGVGCSNGNLYPSWQELGRLRDTYGWSFVSNGQNRVAITSLSPAGQWEESCGSQAAFERHGHHRSWGMYGPGTNRITPAIATDLVGTCFGFVRRYSGGSVNSRSRVTAAPYYVETDDTNGGVCVATPCTGQGFAKPYMQPADLIAELESASPDQWVVLSTYKLVTGSRFTGNRRWDCTAADPRRHWTSEEEAYCLVDFLAVLDALPEGAIVTDPAGMAERWGRNPNRLPQGGGAPTFTPLPSPLNGFGEFQPLGSPVRLSDTRSGLGLPAGPLVAGRRAPLVVTGVGGIPANGVLQVVLNVTVVGPSVPGFLTVVPSGAPPPTTSNLNFVPGRDVPNLVAARVGRGGAVDLVLSSGRAHVVVDAVGWIGSGQTTTPGSRLTLGSPQRKLDTRATAKVGAGRVVAVQVVPPNQGFSGVVVNITATAATAATFVTAYPADRPRPNASILNLGPGMTRPNLAMLRVPPSGVIHLYNHAGASHLVVDLLGTFRRSNGLNNDRTGRLLPVEVPLRLVDTRAPGRPVVAPVVATWDVTVTQTAASTPVSGVLVNLTATAPTAATHLTAFPGGTARPLASNLNVTPGTNVPNLVAVGLSGRETLSVAVGAGSVHVVMDLAAVVLG